MEDPRSRAGTYLKNNIEQLDEDILTFYIDFRKKTNHPLKKKDLALYRAGIRFNLLFLAESVSYSRQNIYNNAIEWSKSYLSSTHIPIEDIITIMDLTKTVFKKKIPAEIRDIALTHLKEGLMVMKTAVKEVPSLLDKRYELFEESKQYLECLLRNDKSTAVKMILELVDSGRDIKDIYMQIFEPAQKELGRLWQKGTITVAQEHYATAVTQLIMSQLYSYIFQDYKKDNIFIGACAQGELHEIGLRMLSDLLEIEGWNTYYLGANVPAESIVKTVADTNAQVIGLSGTMAYHLDEIKNIINSIRNSDECREVKIIVGGYIFNNSGDLWKAAGADYYAINAVEAISIIKNQI
jgi:methanogenic corrinoid protein MtbC1